jgi:flagellar biosynthetic protein FliR
MNADQLLAQVGEQQLAGFILVLARVGPIFLLAPMFSSKSIPPRAKLVIALALSVGIAPIALGARHLPMDVVSMGSLVLKEMLIGAAFAFAIGALFAAVQAAGALLDTFVGFSFGALIDPLTGNQGTILQQFYALVGVMIFLTIGGDEWVIRGLARSYELVPIDAMPSLAAMSGGVQEAFAGIFTVALQISAPVVLALVVTDAAFGVVSRVVPQMNVFSVGFPAKIAVGLLVIGVTLPFAGGFIASELEKSVAQALQSLRVA